MNSPRNPFILGHRIDRPFFCDRESEQQRLTSALINGRNVVLISPRRMGKTSLASLALRDSEIIRNEYTTVSFDILQTNSLAEFTYLFGKAVYDAMFSKGVARVREFFAALSSLKGSFGYDPISGTPSFNIQLGDIRQPQFTLDEIFNYIEKSHRRMIIVIDEFQQVAKYPEKNTEAILRSHIQRLSVVSFVFAGSERTILSDMFLSSNRPFYNSTDIMHLDPIPEEVYVKFATDMFKAYKRSIDSESVKWAFSLFNGNTFYLQRTMNGAFEDTPEGEACEHNAVRRAIKDMLAANEVIYRQMLSNVSAPVKAILLAIAADKTATNPMGADFIRRHNLSTSSSVQYALSKLVRMELITKDGKEYYVSDPLLRIFINNIYSTPEV